MLISSLDMGVKCVDVPSGEGVLAQGNERVGRGCGLNGVFAALVGALFGDLPGLVSGRLVIWRGFGGVLVVS